MKILFGNINGKFFIYSNYFYISFNKNCQRIFHMLNNFNISELWVLTGPGSFIGTRSVLAFSLGYTFNTEIKLMGFNILIDLLPLLTNNKNSNKLFFINELDRFFYCIKEEDLKSRNFFLLSYDQLINYKNTHYLLGNHSIAHENIKIDEEVLFEIIDNIMDKNSFSNDINEVKIEYCGKFAI
jgi:hypothetical protein